MKRGGTGVRAAAVVAAAGMEPPWKWTEKQVVAEWG